MIAHVGGGQADFTVHDAHRGSLPVWRRLSEEGRKRRKGVYPPMFLTRVGKWFGLWRLCENEMRGFGKSAQVVAGERVTKTRVSLEIRRRSGGEEIWGVTRHDSMIVTKCQTLF